MYDIQFNFMQKPRIEILFLFGLTVSWNNALLLDQYETIRSNSNDIGEALCCLKNKYCI